MDKCKYKSNKICDYPQDKPLNCVGCDNYPPSPEMVAEKYYWWCPTCECEVGGQNVTHEEFHDACGTHVEAKPILKPSPEMVCPECDGSGIKYKYTSSTPDSMQSGKCPKCNGTGKVPSPEPPWTNTRVWKSAVALAMIKVWTLMAMIATVRNVTIGA